MRRTLAILGKELRSYFASPIAYVVTTMFLFVTGYFFYVLVSYYALLSLQAAGQPFGAPELNSTERIFRPLFSNISVVMLFVMPLLTMRLFAEERRLGTLELLLSYPVRDGDVIVGKLAAAFAMFALMVALTAAYPLYLAAVGRVEWGPVLTGYLGFLLYGLALLAWGMFFSTLTENQIVAGAMAFTFALLAFIVDWAATFATGRAAQVLQDLSIREHLENFAKGTIDTRDVVFYLLVTALGLFLTWRSLEARRLRS
ncbi:MAG TPA: ABC transporter permease [Thermodesulfobacteriota bacterium]|nr:ABC transporter permease [Thermodesulfobacteriota bacterium]